MFSTWVRAIVRFITNARSYGSKAWSYRFSKSGPQLSPGLTFFFIIDCTFKSLTVISEMFLDCTRILVPGNKFIT